jgi:hypothetical protein
MKAERALAGLEPFLKRAAYVNVLVVAHKRRADEAVIQRLNLHDEVAKDFRAVAVAATSARDDLVLRAYEPGYKPDANELLSLDLEVEPEVSAVVDQVSQVAEAEQFTEDDEIVSHLRFYALVVGAAGARQAVLFRAYSPKKELSRRPGLALMLQKGSYTRLVRKVFLFDEEVDCFAWEGFMFVRNVASFQSMFGYFERLRARAAETVKALVARVPISNTEAFAAACTKHLPMMAKVAQIARKPYLARIGMKEIRRAIDAFPELGIRIVQDGGEKLLFEPEPKKRWRILKLLDDDYLGSVLTQERYEVNSKVAFGK